MAFIKHVSMQMAYSASAVTCQNHFNNIFWEKMAFYEMAFRLRFYDNFLWLKMSFYDLI